MPTQIKPYLMIKNAKEAIDEYQEVFGLEVVERMPYTEEMQMPEGFDYGNSTMHSSLKIGEAQFYMADDLQGAVADKGRVEMMLEPDNLDQMQRIYEKALEKNYEILVKLEKQFWGDYFTRFVDRFGITWQMNLASNSE